MVKAQTIATIQLNATRTRIASGKGLCPAGKVGLNLLKLR